MTHEEGQKIFDYLVKQAVKTLGISRRAAEMRCHAIIKSGILSKFGPPDGIPFQAAIDAAMQIPQMGNEEYDPSLN